MKVSATKQTGQANQAKVQSAQSGIGHSEDSESRELQRQIDELKDELQEATTSNELSIEEKIKERQELFKSINELEAQLKQHQTEQKRAEHSLQNKKSGVYTDPTKSVSVEISSRAEETKADKAEADKKAKEINKKAEEDDWEIFERSPYPVHIDKLM